MPLAGSCENCHVISRELMICVTCGSRVCVNCLNPVKGICKKCSEKPKEEPQEEEKNKLVDEFDLSKIKKANVTVTVKKEG